MKKSSFLLLISLLFILIVFFAINSDYFLTAANFLSITEHMAEFGIMAIGMMLTILVAGIDLTVSSVCGLTSLIIITLIRSSVPLPIAIMLGLAASVSMGTLTGLFIARLEIPPMLLTLAMSMLFTGISYVISEGNAISGFPKEYFFLGQGFIGILPIQTVLYFVITVVMAILLKYTSWGLKVYAVGNNVVATRFSGVNVHVVKMSAYMISGLMAGTAGIVMSSRVATARLDLGASYLTNSIAATVLGGTSIAGGEGSPVGTLLGVAVLSMLSNGLNHIGVSAFIQQLIMGLTLITVVVVNSNVTPVFTRICLSIKKKLLDKLKYQTIKLPDKGS
jgi:ribose transport system permease protein/rhamnose transport system permease protein/inositol transport system permease protein